MNDKIKLNINDINFTSFIERTQLIDLIFHARAAISIMGDILNYDQEGHTFKEIHSLINNLEAMQDRLKNNQMVRDAIENDFKNINDIFGVKNAGI
jgi:hypothetical protein